ncbi:hypothetical protein GGX14DRAFT_610937 [Mycena pura]|uniref:Uncharacterized protein n=1 Tax=Mycena pura TaxID=153505 RepID=A0AAD6YHS3_9AGAR|nr:hypothetical protein GGX14DRAFT_610937 [Mycena pura]
MNPSFQLDKSTIPHFSAAVHIAQSSHEFVPRRRAFHSHKRFSVYISSQFDATPSQLQAACIVRSLAIIRDRLAEPGVQVFFSGLKLGCDVLGRRITEWNGRERKTTTYGARLRKFLDEGLSAGVRVRQNLLHVGDSGIHGDLCGAGVSMRAEATRVRGKREDDATQLAKQNFFWSMSSKRGLISVLSNGFSLAASAMHWSGPASGSDVSEGRKWARERRRGPQAHLDLLVGAAVAQGLDRRGHPVDLAFDLVEARVERGNVARGGRGEADGDGGEEDEGARDEHRGGRANTAYGSLLSNWDAFCGASDLAPQSLAIWKGALPPVGRHESARAVNAH